MARLRRMDEEGGRAGRGQRRRDLAADMAGLAHAGDDDPAARAADQLDRGDEGRAEAVAQRRRKRADAVGSRPSSVRSAEAIRLPCSGLGHSSALDFAISVRGLGGPGRPAASK